MWVPWCQVEKKMLFTQNTYHLKLFYNQKYKMGGDDWINKQLKGIFVYIEMSVIEEF